MGRSVILIIEYKSSEAGVSEGASLFLLRATERTAANGRSVDGTFGYPDNRIQK